MTSCEATGRVLIISLAQPIPATRLRRRETRIPRRRVHSLQFLKFEIPQPDLFPPYRLIRIEDHARSAPIRVSDGEYDVSLAGQGRADGRIGVLGTGESV